MNGLQVAHVRDPDVAKFWMVLHEDTAEALGLASLFKSRSYDEDPLTIEQVVRELHGLW